MTNIFSTLKTSTIVIPQDETSIPLQAPPSTTQAPPPVPQAPSSAPTKMDDMTAAFLRRQPQGLGVVQIFIGVLCILFSLTAAYSQILMVHAPLCLAVTFVVSGSLTLAAVRRPSVSLVLAPLYVDDEWLCVRTSRPPPGSARPAGLPQTPRPLHPHCGGG
uniref:Membrane-spanning 4-domains subfamily A member 15 n=1 Tax=Dicentrarchus labrax TaxID=13489 RepID=A0A8C4E3V9_DICLA